MKSCAKVRKHGRTAKQVASDPDVIRPAVAGTVVLGDVAVSSRPRSSARIRPAVAGTVALGATAAASWPRSRALLLHKTTAIFRAWARPSNREPAAGPLTGGSGSRSRPSVGNGLSSGRAACPGRSFQTRLAVLDKWPRHLAHVTGDPRVAAAGEDVLAFQERFADGLGAPFVAATRVALACRASLHVVAEQEVLSEHAPLDRRG
jgi:hypothetical protein